MKGVVAAGHRLTAEAGARVLADGGNAVDAAVAAVLMSFVAEPTLTGPGAGGFMLLHTASGENHLLDFFVAAPGRGLDGRLSADIEAIEVRFSEEGVQTFGTGPASCGVYGTPAGLADASERFGTIPLSALTARPVSAAREGVEVSPMQAFLFEILGPILRSTPECRAIFEPEDRPLRTGDRLALPQMGDLLERFGAEGPGFLYSGDHAAAVSEWVLAHGGLITLEDLATYRVIERAPALARYRGREILTNPPPASGGILIAYALDLLERLGEAGHLSALVGVMDQTNKARTEEFNIGLHTEGYLERFLAAEALESAAHRVRGDLGPTTHRAPRDFGPTTPRGRNDLGSTTHISVMDADGACASVTCSNGSSSGVVVPGTGIHLNNMLGEEDLNPLGHHRHRPGNRVPSMMAPTVVLEAGRAEMALGSAGSNRIRSAILQTIMAVIDDGLEAQEAVSRPRLHYEGGVVEAEPGVDPHALEELERQGWSVQRWREQNLYFGGVQAVARHPESGDLTGGGDPRRGGVAVGAE